ncbi:MAG: hypothetical protein SGPRY_011902, partial [Prymnesium sp.]
MLSILLTAQSHAPFEACVRQKSGPSTPVLTQSDPDFTAASLCLNHRSDLASSPRAIVRAKTVGDVQAAVDCAVAYGLDISPRSGAHSFENHSCKGKVILDVSDLMDFSFEPSTRQVTWGSGHTNGQLYMKLEEEGMTLPLGAEGDVGSAGLVLGCGRGPITQYYGRICDRLMAVEYVDSRGVVRWATNSSNADMLWMARGGGGEFPGVVTKFTAIAAPVPRTVHKRECDLEGGQDGGKAVIQAWTRGLRETSKSARKMYSYVHFFPNTGSIGVSYNCFDCRAAELAWFVRKTDEITNGYNGTCSAVTDHQGAHPQQFINFLAEEPRLGTWQTLPLKPHYWPGESRGIIDERSTAGAYYGYSYEVNMGMLDELWKVIYSAPASTSGDLGQQFYFYSMESDAFAQTDGVGAAFNGFSAKWVLHFKIAGGSWSDDEMRAHSALVSDAISRHLPCNGFYNYIPSEMPCAHTGNQMLASYFSSPSWMKVIKASHDPSSVFRNPLLLGALPEAAQALPPPLPPTTNCEAVWDVIANGYTCGSRIDWLVDNQGLSAKVARLQLAQQYPRQCGACGTASTSSSQSPRAKALPSCDVSTWGTVQATGPFTAREESAQFSMGEQLCVIGGRGNLPIECLDTRRLVWSRKSARTFDVHHAQPVWYDGELWLAVAWTGPFTLETQITKSLVYNVQLDELRTTCDIPQDHARGAAGVVTYEDSIII